MRKKPTLTQRIKTIKGTIEGEPEVKGINPPKIIEQTKKEPRPKEIHSFKYVQIYNDKVIFREIEKESESPHSITTSDFITLVIKYGFTPGKPFTVPCQIINNKIIPIRE